MTTSWVCFWRLNEVCKALCPPSRTKNVLFLSVALNITVWPQGLALGINSVCSWAHAGGAGSSVRPCPPPSVSSEAPRKRQKALPPARLSFCVSVSQCVPSPESICSCIFLWNICQGLLWLCPQGKESKPQADEPGGLRAGGVPVQSLELCCLQTKLSIHVQPLIFHLAFSSILINLKIYCKRK